MPVTFAGHSYARMNGAGNQILVLDLRGSGLAMNAAAARAIGRGAGLAFDQLMAVAEPRSAEAEASVTIWNIDGTQAGACGNGMRCVAWRLMRDDPRREIAVETPAGLLACTRVADWEFTIDMGPPRFGWAEIPLAFPPPDTSRVDLAVPGLPPASMVSMGNPHAVFFAPGLSGGDAARLGPMLETHPIFPEKANISFAEVLAPDHIKLRVWERGVGFTQACGSAACATLAAAARDGLSARRARVSLPGGDLWIDWREGDGHVLMTGPVELEREGRLDAALFEGAAA